MFRPWSWVLAFAVLVAHPLARPQSLQISSLPTYGAPGSLTGVASGVAFATHKVAVYIHIEGQGWWSKPTAATPHVSIAANGTFSANVVGGGNDRFATLFMVALLANSSPTPVVTGSPSVPTSPNFLAVDIDERYGPTFQFAHRTWAIKESAGGAGPNANCFSRNASDVWVDALGRLHLTVHQQGGVWCATEVILLGEYLGHGTYWFTTESELDDLDRDVTFGAFTWDVYGDSATGDLHRELDCEDSRWGSAADPTSSQFAVQPYTVAGNLERYALPDLSADPTMTRFFVWEAAQVHFVAARGVQVPCAVPPGSVVRDWTYVHAPGANHLVPQPGRERFRFNLWPNGGAHAPSNGQPVEVIVSDFGFSCAPLCAITTYCASAPNSTGTGARICSLGTTSIAANDLELAASNAPAGKTGLFFYGSTQMQVPFGNGWRCVGNGASAVLRLGPLSTTTSEGSLRRRVDFTVPPASGGAGAITAGSTWNFQLWFRDPSAGGANVNLSDALRATFGP